MKYIKRLVQLTARHKPRSDNTYAISFNNYNCIIHILQVERLKMAAKAGYYPDGVTKYTDPFYKCVCRDCMHRFWSVTINISCSVCGSMNVFRDFDDAKADEEFERLMCLKKSEEVRGHPR